MKYFIIIPLFFVFLYGCSDGYPDLGDGYKIIGEGGYTIAVVNSVNTIMISEYILDYSMYSNFILISQSPPDSLPKMKVFIFSDNDRKKIANDKNVFRQYWIINKKQDNEYKYDSLRHIATYKNVYGPFNTEGYELQKQILNVSENLKLESE